jgi:hypothetical protein
MAAEQRMANKHEVSKLLPRIGSVVFGALAFLTPAMARAANSCPWMNEATASGLLGGDAVGAFSAGQDQPSLCTFTQHDGNETRTLQIAVETAANPHARFLFIAQTCKSPAVQIAAIGNEAMVCPIDPHGNEVGERIMGRVRDQVFTIALSSSLKTDTVLTKETLRVKLGIAAEQVTGNLF